MNDNINYSYDIDKILDHGHINGSDIIMGELIHQISELQERLYVASLFKSCFGIIKTIEEFSLCGGIIELAIQEHFSEYLLTCYFTPPKKNEAYITKTADTLINAYLSNVRFNSLVFELSGKTPDQINGTKIQLNPKTFKDSYFTTLLEKNIITNFENQYMQKTLNLNGSSSKRGKI